MADPFTALAADMHLRLRLDAHARPDGVEVYDNGRDLDLRGVHPVFDRHRMVWVGSAYTTRGIRYTLREGTP